MKDSSELGYQSFETFASILEDHDKKGTLEGLLAKHPIPLRSAYVTVNVTDPSQRKAQIEMLQRYAKILKKYGGSFLVQSANGPRTNKRRRQSQLMRRERYGKAVNAPALAPGLTATRASRETREETTRDAAVDTR